MTRQLEEFFNLPAGNELDNDEYKKSLQTIEDLDRQLTDVDITDLATSDKEMDELANKAIDHYDDLMDLGMNVEPRFSAPIFEAATKLMGHAITAKTNKIDKKLKLLDLEIKKRRLELQEKQADVSMDSAEGNVKELNRNELLDLIRNKNNNNI